MNDQLLADWTRGMAEQPYIAELAKAAEAGDISEPPEPKVWHNVEISAGFKIEKATLRLALKQLTGAVDYGPEPGWMVVPKNG